MNFFWEVVLNKIRNYQETLLFLSIWFNSLIIILKKQISWSKQLKSAISKKLKEHRKSKWIILILCLQHISMEVWLILLKRISMLLCYLLMVWKMHKRISQEVMHILVKNVDQSWINILLLNQLLKQKTAWSN